MNSRAALEEEEAIRKAIEESKSDGTGGVSSNGNRKPRNNGFDTSGERAKQKHSWCEKRGRHRFGGCSVTLII